MTQTEIKWETTQIIQMNVHHVKKPVLRKVSDNNYIVDVGDFACRIDFFFESEEQAKKVFNLE